MSDAVTCGDVTALSWQEKVETGAFRALNLGEEEERKEAEEKGRPGVFAMTSLNNVIQRELTGSPSPPPAATAVRITPRVSWSDGH